MRVLLLALALQVSDPPPTARQETVVPLQIDADDSILDGRGRCESFEHVCETSGALHVWTRVEDDTDLFLRVDAADGTRVGEDDDSGGGRTPYLKLGVERGQRLRVRAAVAKPETGAALEPRRLRLHLVLVPETDATRAASTRLERGYLQVVALRSTKDLDAARARLGGVVQEAATLPVGELSREPLQGLFKEARTLGMVEAECAAGRILLAHVERTRPPEHEELQSVRRELARALLAAGASAEARGLLEQVLAARLRALPQTHLDVQTARIGLAAALHEERRYEAARALLESALEVLASTRPESDASLQIARANLGLALYELGEFEAARGHQELVLAHRERTLPQDHPGLQRARGSLASTLAALGHLAEARALEERVLEIWSRSLPPEDPLVSAAMENLALTIRAMGDLARARELQEEVLAARERTLGPLHRSVQAARGNLAVTLSVLGDHARARSLEEDVLAALSRALSEDHPDVQSARENLALRLRRVGEDTAARALQEEALASRSRTHPPDHPDVLRSRTNLATILRDLGEFVEARAIEEDVLRIRERTLHADHPDLLTVRENLAASLRALGDLHAARQLLDGVLKSYGRTLPDDHPDRQRVRWVLASTIARQAAHDRWAGRAVDSGDRASCGRLAGEIARAAAGELHRMSANASAREREQRALHAEPLASFVLSLAHGYGVLEPYPELAASAFELCETMRASSMRSLRGRVESARSPEEAALEAELRRAKSELAATATKGSGSAAYRASVELRDELERKLFASSRGSTRAGPAVSLEELRARLPERAALVGFRSFTRRWIPDPRGGGTPAPAHSSERALPGLTAFVVGARGEGEALDLDPRPILVDLGPMEPIERAVLAWRAAIAASVDRGKRVASAIPEARALGLELRRLILDPILVRVQGVDRFVVALDDVLHLVTLDALPLEDEGVCVGDRWRIETRATLAELGADRPKIGAGGALVALGGAAFDSRPVALEAEDVATLDPGDARAAPSILRGGPWERGFDPLTYSGLEARGIATRFEEQFGAGAETVVLEKRKASRAALEALAPKARWLHVATHGWFASESVRSWIDAEPVDAQLGLVQRESGLEQVRGMSPMLLCGLALAGANLPEDELGRAPGLITAEELAGLDLSSCELAVLSACDTARGEIRRAGQGVASLQKALQIAGARSVITSLWKVPDEATKELMLDFYRRVWVEKQPKWKALWEAKRRLREAKDEQGNPKYSLRDWAAWVLTGEPE
ncbi:MAG: CHAT domain-containing protein [Planctomycetes bacterium]|nr:CHAT domain-containing protein [Planctomycetota bacterium]